MRKEERPMMKAGQMVRKEINDHRDLADNGLEDHGGQKR